MGYEEENGGGRVCLGTRRKAVQLNALALSSSRCQELANFYFGFNGWSKRIIKVSYFSWKQCGQGEEECLSDVSFEEEEFRCPELG
nr:RAD52 motif-containing protein 1-like [Vicugna pacos]